MKSERVHSAAWFKASHLIIPFLACLIFLSFHGEDPCLAQPLSLNELMNQMKVSAADQKKMMDGEVVAYKRVPTSDTELGITLACFVPVPMEHLPKKDFGRKLAALDRTVLEYRILTRNASIEAFRGLSWKKNAKEETKWLLKAEPGDRFNLSLAEIQTLQKLKKNAPPSTFLETYQEFLFARFRAFVTGGLDNVAPYARGGDDVTRPGNEIKRGFSKFAEFLRVLPGFSKAVIDYPQNQPEGLKASFYVENQLVEDRPTFILGRQVWRITPKALILAETQYYVGHSYNGMLAMRGAFAVERGVFVFYTNRTFTDQITGFGSGMKRSIGLSMHKDALIKELEKIRDHMVTWYQSKRK